MSSNEDAETGDSVPPEAGEGFVDIQTKSADLRLARGIVSTLVQKGVKVLALDFDKTIVSVHTAGFWRQGTPNLAEHVRPCFKALIQAALETKLHVCVVTYSMQPILIRDVLKLVLPKCDTHKILIRANSKDWLPQQSLAGQCYGKQPHIAWIVTELANNKHAIIHPAEILLLDDDIENVTIAQQFGHLAFEVADEVSLENIQDFVNEIEVRKEIPSP